MVTIQEGSMIDADKPKPLTPVERRLIEQAAEIMQDDPQQVLFQHTVLCQTFFPYRDQGDEVREWTRTNGQVALFLQAGAVMNPDTGEMLKVGLPFGPKSRLLLAHLNSRALKQGQRCIEIEESSLTAFVKAMQDPLKCKAVAPNGREVRAFKEQLTRLSAANVMLATRTADGHARHRKPRIIDGFEIWFQKNDRQRVLWPDHIDLSPEYFESLQRHAVPLDERALAALGHSAMALDVYSWLAQRLHRIPPGKKVFLPRSILKQQFGAGYARQDNFAHAFREALRQAVSQYNTANVTLSREGLTMTHSLPPVPPRLFAVPALPTAKPNSK
jgi:hypothetical protein